MTDHISIVLPPCAFASLRLCVNRCRPLPPAPLCWPWPLLAALCQSGLIALTGEVRFDERRVGHVSTQVEGIIKLVHVALGDKVKKDQIIARIDPQTFELRVNQARADVDSARSAVAVATAALAMLANHLGARDEEIPAGTLVSAAVAKGAIRRARSPWPITSNSCWKLPAPTPRSNRRRVIHDIEATLYAMRIGGRNGMIVAAPSPIDSVTPAITVLEFPRDLWVEIPDIADNLNGQDHEKLNQAFLYGQPGFKYWDDPTEGSGLLALTLNKNFGANVDHYITVNMRTFEQVIDARDRFSRDRGDDIPGDDLALGADLLGDAGEAEAHLDLGAVRRRLAPPVDAADRQVALGGDRLGGGHDPVTLRLDHRGIDAEPLQLP